MAMFASDMTRNEAEAVGVKVAINLARDMRAHVDGFYFMTPFNRATMIEKVIKGL
jgi:homocysteine S-methyltransferase